MPDTPTLADVLRRPAFIATSSILARRSFMEALPPWRAEVLCGDLVVRLWGAHVGKIGYLRDIMSIRCRHAGGLSMRAGHRRMAAEALQAYALFDEATQRRHHRLVRARMVFERQHARFGPMAYLLHPGQALQRFREYRTGAGL